MDKQKPAVWIGHVFVKSTDVPKTIQFFEQIGIRNLFSNDTLGVLELRAGTHIVLEAGKPDQGDEAYFDLMVEDIDEAHQNYGKLDLNPTEIERGKIHDHFFLTEAGGNTFRINSSHASGKPV